MYVTGMVFWNSVTHILCINVCAFKCLTIYVGAESSKYSPVTIGV